jgi:hypothetical protein
MVGNTVYQAVDDHTSVAGQAPPNAHWGLWFATSSAVDTVVASLTKDSVTVPAGYDGIVTSYAGADGAWQVMAGTTDVTSQFLPVVIVSNPGTLNTNIVGAAFAVTGSFDQADDFADLTMRVTGTGSFAGMVFDRTFRVNKLRAPFSVDTTPPAMPTGLTLSSVTTTKPDGTQQSTLSANWNANAEADLNYYILSVRQGAGAFIEYIIGGTSWSALAIAGQSYDAKLRAVDTSGNKSTSTALTASHTVAGDSTAPGAPTGLNAAASFQNIFLYWTNPSATDLARIEI